MERHPALTIATALIALATVAFCFLNCSLIPAWTGVRNAGLGTNPNSSAAPTLLPPTPTSGLVEVPQPCSIRAKHFRVWTIHLEWIALNNTGLVVGFRFSGLPKDKPSVFPRQDFENVEAQDFRGRILQLYSGEVLTGEFTSLQVVNDPRAKDGVDLSLQIPLTDAQGNLIDTFVFPLKNIPATSTSPRVGQFSRAVKIDNVMVRLDWAKLSPEMTQLQFCYTLPQNAESLSKSDIRIQSGYPAEQHTQGTARMCCIRSGVRMEWHVPLRNSIAISWMTTPRIGDHRPHRGK